MTTNSGAETEAPAERLKLVLDLADRDLARSIAGALQDLLEPPPEALTLFENGPGKWRIEAYYGEPMDGAELARCVADITGLDVPAFTTEAIPDLNWVTISQSALPPVVAGRFTVHGSHDRAKVAQGPNAILIDAGEAFGTAHHATTHGCLLALDRITRVKKFRDCLDLGCGSGVLAIALARAMPRARIAATDIDAQSVIVARSNMRANRAGHRIAALVASGLDHPRLRRPARFDLVVANILAEPLIRLAPAVSRALRRGGTLVVSGILVPQAPEVIAAYRAQGVALATHYREAGWSTLTLTRR
jgi:ribosomal protein L11 methyltransferase